MENNAQQLVSVAAKIVVIEAEMQFARQNLLAREKQFDQSTSDKDSQKANILLNSAGAQLHDLSVIFVKLMDEKMQISNEISRLRISVSSCHSNSVSVQGPQGMQINRRGANKKTFRNDLLQRDQRCIATGEQDRGSLKAAHIIPISRSETIDSEDVYHVRNGVLLRDDLEEQYDLFKWYFDECGQVIVLFNGWPHKNFIKTVSISTVDGPGVDLIIQHNKYALERAPHHCPDCWKLVGKPNIVKHCEKSGGSCNYNR